MADQTQEQEAKTTRGIDAHPENPGKADRQEIHSPTEQMGKATPHTGPGPRRDSRPDDQSAQPVPMTTPTAGQLESDEGVAEQEKDPIE